MIDIEEDFIPLFSVFVAGLLLGIIFTSINCYGADILAQLGVNLTLNNTSCIVDTVIT